MTFDAAQSEYLCFERRLARNRPRSIHLIRLSRSRIEHSSPDSDVHAKRTEFAVATGDHPVPFGALNTVTGGGSPLYGWTSPTTV